MDVDELPMIADHSEDKHVPNKSENTTLCCSPDPGLVVTSSNAHCGEGKELTRSQVSSDKTDYSFQTDTPLKTDGDVGQGKQESFHSPLEVGNTSEDEVVHSSSGVDSNAKHSYHQLNRDVTKEPPHLRDMSNENIVSSSSNPLEISAIPRTATILMHNLHRSRPENQMTKETGSPQGAEEQSLDCTMQPAGDIPLPGKRKIEDCELEDGITSKVPKITEVGVGQSSHNCLALEGREALNRQEKEKRCSLPSSTLCESDVGILAYISDHKGFTGIIKERYEDFVVHEIDQEGKVVHLTDFSCPKEEKSSTPDTSGALSAEDIEALDKLQNSTDQKSHHLIDVTSATKESRTKVHMAIRQNYKGLESNTVDQKDSKYIKVVQKTANSRKPSNWPKDRPRYLRFVLSKENHDTNEVLSLMAKYLRIKPQAFQYAGTKDKRAVTVQEMTIHKHDANEVAKLNQKLKLIRVGNFRYVNKALNLGELSGNHFDLVLRDVTGSRPEMEKALKSLKERGFINYFGMQRFGNTSVPTHHIGRAVLKNQWEEAINLILLPKPGDNSEWRKHWRQTRDAKSTLEKMPFDRRLSLEQQVLKSLASTTNNFCQAFASIPRNSRLLYLHSYQSRVWNLVASKRIPKRGLFVNAGDLVARRNDNTSWVSPEKVEDETLNEYSIDDVVLPLPGHSVHYPENEAKLYSEILAEDGLSLDDLKHKIKDYSLPGAYRKLIIRPTNVSWSFVRYDDATKKLIQTDLDKIEGIPEPAPEDVGSKLALKLSFSLPSSAYATMALRELLKTETSASHQAAISLKNKSSEQELKDLDGAGQSS